eukprot:12069574-Prorocentrum_lima.AAC.1
MTSSLVGSEMCIRDSLKCDRCGFQRDRCGCQCDRCDFSLTGVAVSAVSYTHLTLPTICSV